MTYVSEMLSAETASPPRPGWRSLTAGLRTIRGSVFIAFSATAFITACLALYGIASIRHAGELVRKTYDQSLMSINYARAAQADFEAMRAAFARNSRTHAADEHTAKQLMQLERSLKQDIAVAAQRSQSVRAKMSADRASTAVAQWIEATSALALTPDSHSNFDDLDTLSEKVSEEIDLLINYTAGDGFLYRQSAAETVEREVQLNFIGATAGLFLCALVGWLLTRRMVIPVSAASAAAKCIANGKLDVDIPTGGGDELGELLGSMRLMRDNIKGMMEREVTLRQSAQIRLAEAVESSREGIVVVDGEQRIALANGQAASFLSLPIETLEPGTELSHVHLLMKDRTLAEHTIAAAPDQNPHDDLQLSDGRWIRVSRNATSEGGFIVVCSDVTASKIQEATLRDSNLRLDAALENMSQGLCLFGSDNRLKLLNRRFFEIFGLSPQELTTGMDLAQIQDVSAHFNSVVQDVFSLLARRVTSATKRTGTHYHDLKDGRIIASVFSVTQDDGWIATFEDVTERRQAESRIMHMARHDALTDLPNRLLFREKLEKLLERREKVAVLFLDLDRFKPVNDTLGHPVGDALLCAVADRIRSHIRGKDLLARLGGDEFAILQVDSGPTRASELAERIVQLVAHPFEVFGHQVVIGASIGIAVAPSDGLDPDQLLRNSDMALYRAKSYGRGCYHFFQPEMDVQMQTRHALERDLRSAITHQMIDIHYQPIVDVQSGRLLGFEALARWLHESRGFIPPDVFVSLAEEVGLIGPLGDLVLRKACRDASSWPAPLTVAVNLSAVQFRNAGLPLSIASAVADSGLPTSRLELEITESVFLENDRTNLETLHAIHGLGARISLDDFGTGYSSLSYLRSFPFDKIKIDRSFVAELGTRADCVAIIRAVAQLGQSLGMKTLAEGVETSSQLQLLRAEGVLEAQGYLFGKAVPAVEADAIINKFVGSVAA